MVGEFMKVNLVEMEKRVDLGAVRRSIGNDGLIVWCYTEKAQYEKLWDEYTKIARGIVTNAEGNVISRPFPKFFNLGEVDANALPWHADVEITEKMDGSLIVVSFYKGRMIVNSKGSFNTVQANFARQWLMEHMASWVEMECHDSLAADGWHAMTYCFEAIFPENRIVVRYGDRRELVLLAIINNEYGSEMDYGTLKWFGTHWNISVTPRYEAHNMDEIARILEKVKARSSTGEGEGVVMHFRDQNNTRVKMKSDEYVRIHRLVSQMNEKHVLDILVQGGNVEQVYEALPDEFYKELEEIMDDLRGDYNAIMDRADDGLRTVMKLPSRKEQGIYLMDEKNGYRDIMGIIFGLCDSHDVSKEVWKHISRRRKELRKTQQQPLEPLVDE
jgi:RNA ligase